MIHDEALPKPLLNGVLLGLIITLLPHALHLPAWLIILALAAVAWRHFAAKFHWRSPSRPLRLGATAAIFVIIYVGCGGINDPHAGVSLLVAMVAVKLLETKQRRDAMLLLFLSYLLIGSIFLFNQHIILAIYALGAITWITATLLQAAQENQNLAWRLAVRHSAALIGQAIPVMLVLFILFPRLSGPLWSVPHEGGKGQTGMSGYMEPGSIGELSLSQAVAFRVRFLDKPPQASELYWRGPVLWRFNGQSWSTDDRPGDNDLSKLELQGQALRYEVMLEPHGQHWLLALDMPVRTNRSDARWLAGQLLTDHEVNERIRYLAISYPQYQLEPNLSAEDRQRGLSLPVSSNPRAAALAHQWRAQGLNDRQIIKRALAQFHDQAFFYTLHPPKLQGNTIDEFLFQSRRGFCEHYASTFAFLMRAAGIPARIVLGYQGGEHSPISGYYLVRQADAHAWTEVWLADAGWVRIDPTAAIAPDRIEADVIAGLSGTTQRERDGMSWLHQFGLAWDAINYHWNDWVLGYGPERQQQTLRGLGLAWLTPSQLVLLMTTLVLAILATTSTLLLWHRQPRTETAGLQYRRFCKSLALLELIRAPHEGPADFGRRCAQQYPELAPLINRFIHLYIEQRYQSQTQVELHRQMRRLLLRLRWIILRMHLARLYKRTVASQSSKP